MSKRQSAAVAPKTLAGDSPPIMTPDGLIAPREVLVPGGHADGDWSGGDAGALWLFHRRGGLADDAARTSGHGGPRLPEQGSRRAAGGSPLCHRSESGCLPGGGTFQPAIFDGECEGNSSLIAMKVGACLFPGVTERAKLYPCARTDNPNREVSSSCRSPCGRPATVLFLAEVAAGRARGGGFSHDAAQDSQHPPRSRGWQPIHHGDRNPRVPGGESGTACGVRPVARGPSAPNARHERCELAPANANWVLQCCM